MKTYEKICAVSGKAFTASGATAKNCPEIRALFDQYSKKFNVVTDLRNAAAEMLKAKIEPSEIIQALLELAPAFEDKSNAKSAEIREYNSLKAISARRQAKLAAYQTDNRDEEQKDIDERSKTPITFAISELGIDQL